MNKVYSNRFKRTMCSEFSGITSEKRVLTHVDHFLKNLGSEANESYNDYVENHIKFCDNILHLIRSGYSIIIPTSHYWGVFFK